MGILKKTISSNFLYSLNGQFELQVD